MKRLFVTAMMVFALFGLVFAMNASASAYDPDSINPMGHPAGLAPQMCAQAFHDLKPIGSNGLLTYSEWQAAHYGAGSQKGIGPAGSGNATAFYSMDSNHDGVVTMGEFCRYKIDR